jgi:DNA-binding GntR family transcriptional regulator
VTTPESPRVNTTQQYAVDWIRSAIVRGDLRPGERIPQEDVAERVGVSVGPVREALRVLEGEGQITYIPRRGYFVTVLRIEDLVEIYELRKLLETRAVRQAVADFDHDALERVAQAAEECRAAAEAGDVGNELAANRRFHFALFESADQAVQLKIIKMLWESTEAYRALYYSVPGEGRAAAAAHQRILQAARARDGDRLVSELDKHRDRALKTLAKILAGNS